MAEVSIVMAAYNAERFIADAIASVVAQSFRDWELIVVDDGSRDGTAAVVEGFAAGDPRVKLLSQANSGHPGRARNAGMRRASGRYLAFLDADDRYAPGRLERCRDVLEAHGEGCGFLFHDFETIDADDRVLRRAVLRDQGFPAAPYCRATLLGDGLYAMDDSLAAFLVSDFVACWTGAVMLRTDCLPAAERVFADDVAIGEDLDLWLRVILSTRVLYLDECLSSYRKHGDGITNQGTRFVADTITVIERYGARIAARTDAAAARRIDARLQRLHADIGYKYLDDGDCAQARAWYGRGYRRYGGNKNLVGYLKSCLPWTRLRAACGR